MNIQTKFNVGDTVWPVLTLDNKFFLVGFPIGISHLTVSESGISYYMDYRSTGWDEKYLFPTESEAEAECIKRNGGKGE